MSDGLGLCSYHFPARPKQETPDWWWHAGECYECNKMERQITMNMEWHARRKRAREEEDQRALKNRSVRFVKSLRSKIAQWWASGTWPRTEK